MRLSTREVVLVKGRHRYVFRVAEGQEPRGLFSAVELARRRSSGFDFRDAALVGFGLCRLARQRADGRRRYAGR